MAAQLLLGELRGALGIPAQGVRILCRYDAEGLSAEKTVYMANLAASYCARQTPPWPKADDAFRAEMEKKLEEYL